MGSKSRTRGSTSSSHELHTPDAVRQRLSESPRPSHLRDLIYGAIDGTVTTFAVVAGVEGAGLAASVVIILGFANLVADGFSMAVSNFLATRAEMQQRALARSEEEREIADIPEGEREEIRQIFALKGFTGEELDRVVDVITRDRSVWVDTMMMEELGFSPARHEPFRSAASTFVAFITVGFVPLFVFVLDAVPSVDIAQPFLWSSIMTAGAFFTVGALKSRFVAQHWWLSGFETLLVGGAAATIAYVIGALLQNVGVT